MKTRPRRPATAYEKALAEAKAAPRRSRRRPARRSQAETEAKRKALEADSRAARGGRGDHRRHARRRP